MLQKRRKSNNESEDIGKIDCFCVEVWVEVKRK